MFLRVKKLKGKEYCYLVENRWKKGKTQQKVRKYLGAAVRFESADKDFFDFYRNYSFEGKKAEDILRDVVLWELAKAAVHDNGGAVEKDVVFVNKKRLELRRNGKKAVLALNEGYLCDFTLKEIMKFRKSGEIRSDSVVLARAFVDAGLDIPKEVFIEFFNVLD